MTETRHHALPAGVGVPIPGPWEMGYAHVNISNVKNTDEKKQLIKQYRKMEVEKSKEYTISFLSFLSISLRDITFLPKARQTTNHHHHPNNSTSIT